MSKKFNILGNASWHTKNVYKRFDELIATVKRDNAVNGNSELAKYLNRNSNDIVLIHGFIIRLTIFNNIQAILQH